MGQNFGQVTYETVFQVSTTVYTNVKYFRTGYRLERHDQAHTEHHLRLPHSRHHGIDVVPVRELVSVRRGGRLSLSTDHRSLHDAACVPGPVRDGTLAQQNVYF